MWELLAPCERSEAAPLRHSRRTSRERLHSLAEELWNAQSVGMRRVALVSCWLTVLAAALVATAAVPEASADDKPDASVPRSVLPACISVATEARYVPYGYNHVVLLKNGCSKPATCTVSTNVNPQATAVEVASKANVEVLTFTASPAQTFTANVSCALH